jgi:cell division protein FtsZ
MRAAEQAINHPLLESSIDNARGVLIQFAAASNMKLKEVNDAAKLIQEVVHPTANIIFGTSIDNTLGDEMRVTVIGAGFDEVAPRPAYRSNGFTAPSSGPIQIVEPVAEVVEEAAEVPSWFAGSTATISAVPTASSYDDVEDDEEEEQAPPVYAQPKPANRFDDGLDIPDFLQ